MSDPTRGTARVLVADDEPSIRFVLREALESDGHQVTDVDSGDAAWESLASGSFDLAFLDVRMPGATGLELLERLREIGSQVAVVIITAQNTLENAVEAMKQGALDYLVKPFAVDDVLALVTRALRTRALEAEVRGLRREAGERTTETLVGRSPALLEVFKTVGRVARSDVSVLITGESGTGKELVARAIHGASDRGAGPFIAVNSAAIPRELLESELFGHERGAFTGAVAARIGRFREAHSGTLFLDEIGDMPPELQAKLLRVLQSGEVTAVGGRHPEQVDVRILAATHRDLDSAVSDGRFREDLLYRLRVVPIHIPPLRERTEDVAALAKHFLGQENTRQGGPPRSLSGNAMKALSEHAWPGNVRELENAIRRALVLSTSEVLRADDFAFLAGSPSLAGAASGGAASDAAGAEALEAQVAAETEAALAGEETGELYRELLERVERPLLETVLARTGGNQIRAAALLGINRNTLRKKISELGIEIPRRD